MKFNFTSQICSSRLQSERLLALGLKKETADMCWTLRDSDREGNEYSVEYMSIGRGEYQMMHPNWYTPAWSLHRLIKMLTYQVVLNGKKYEPVIAINGMAYQDVCDNDPIVGWTGQLYDDVIDCIGWLISIEQFNKEYLE